MNHKMIIGSDFFRKWLHRNWLIFAAVQFLVLILAMGIAYLLYYLVIDVAIIIGVSAGLIILSELIIGFMIIGKSIGSIMAVASKFDSEIELSGIKNRGVGVQYLLDAIDDAKSSKPVAIDSTEDHTAENLLAALPVGVIVMNENQEIITSSSSAPVFIENGQCKIQLNFDSVTESLDDWLKNAVTNEISSKKIWTQIPNVAFNTTIERRIFDVIAHYNKKSLDGFETVIVTVDRTEDYKDLENDMDFVALAAHELRTPITVIRGYLDVLERQKVDTMTGQERKSIERIANAANNLSGYITNILNISRYEHQDLKLNVAEVSVGDIITGIRDSVELNARALRRNLRFEITENLPSVAADVSLIGEVLANLIGNAVKYSPVNSDIIVHVQQSDQNFVEFSIIDHGIGIAENAMPSLFNKFSRHYRSKGATPGTGLGLYISRAIIKNHGGNISVGSVEGEGSTFTFTIPTFVAFNSKKLGQNHDFAIQSHSKIYR
ncbi:ATP-binding protein [Candidatus Saccharibacteria bacterium]|nr:ATP-binding protein [Candidatus Saccharibacteria bacterium]MCL1962740.1 ATP-binding protein [Candidatus Saccharibacteria bacterium]